MSAFALVMSIIFVSGLVGSNPLYGYDIHFSCQTMVDATDVGDMTGDSAERGLCRYLSGFSNIEVIRAAGSGSVSRACPDVAWSSAVGGTFGAEIKTTTVKDRAIYIDKSEIDELRKWCLSFAGNAVFVVNMPSLTEPRVVPSGKLKLVKENRYKICPEVAHLRGIPLSDFVGDSS